MPLSYVIRVEDEPEYNPETPYVSFVDQSIGCAPLSGAAYISDRRKVHQLLISHLNTVMQQWIEPVQKKQDGRLSYEALKGPLLRARIMLKIKLIWSRIKRACITLM